MYQKVSSNAAAATAFLNQRNVDAPADLPTAILVEQESGPTQPGAAAANRGKFERLVLDNEDGLSDESFGRKHRERERLLIV